MATWLMHIYIGDKLTTYFSNKNLKLDPKAFALGCVGADAGDVTDIKGVFDPPAYITHWTYEDAGSDKSNCRYIDFYEAYLHNKKNKHNVTKWSFYMGYMVHLYTDVLWHKLVYIPLLNQYSQSIDHNPMIIHTMRQSSLACELEYLRQGNTFPLWESMKSMKEFSIPVLPYYHEKSLTNHIQFIQQVYGKKAVMEFVPLTNQIFFLEDWLNFAETAVTEIQILLKELAII